MRPNSFDIEEIIEALDGTDSELEDVLPEGMTIEDMLKKDWRALDGALFRCEVCSFWYRYYEESEDDGVDLICKTCGDDQLEEGDYGEEDDDYEDIEFDLDEEEYKKAFEEGPDGHEDICKN